MYFILFYETVADYMERRPRYRDEHLAYARRAHESGALVMAGALDDPPDSAVLVFQGEDPSVAEDFARSDPYVKAGLISEWRVRPWVVVFGG